MNSLRPGDVLVRRRAFPEIERRLAELLQCATTSAPSTLRLAQKRGRADDRHQNAAGW